MKRSAALEPLSHDHFESLHLARRLRTALDARADAGPLAAEVVRFWEDALAGHFQQEEALLVEPLGRVGGGDLAARMVAEHAAIRALIEAVRGAPAEPGPVGAFADALPAHVRFEEREVFPHLERRLAPEALRALGEALRHAPSGGAGTDR